MEEPAYQPKDFDYELPEDQIAANPLAKRDEANLLVYNQGKLDHTQFKHLGDYMPKGAMLVFNNTKVVQARMIFYKHTGARIELFCLEPSDKSLEINLAMQQKGAVQWECLVGNKKKWKTGQVLQGTITNYGESINLKARLEDEGSEGFHIQFYWEPNDRAFAEIMELFGQIPLPPYIKREVNKNDYERYQTIYAQREGAVAAPTAGLHFTDQVFRDLNQKGIDKNYLTLHVGAGTFQPVTTENLTEHPMHEEQFVFTPQNIEGLLNYERIIPVGTTSLRALESLYWYGVKLLKEGEQASFFIEKLCPYKYKDVELPNVQNALEAILKKTQQDQLYQLTGKTELFIFPGYSFKLVHDLITNFHLPKSTLLMLVAALIGDDWKQVYQSALTNNYRFLSYGDGSLLLP